jgi:hypothetical protein
MLPDFRFLIGAVLATGMLSVAGVGLTTAVRLSHEARVGPSQASRSLAFDERADWNQFSDPELARRFAHLAHQPDDAGTAPVSDGAAIADSPFVASPVSEVAERDEPSASAPAEADSNIAMAVNVEETVADFDQQASTKSAPLTIAIAPPAQEPAAPPADATDAVEPLTVVTDTGPLTNFEVAAAPATVEIAVAPTPVEITAEPAAAEHLASTSAAVPDEPTEIAQPAIPPDAAPSFPQLRMPLPQPKPKRVDAKSPAKAKVAKKAKAAKPQPRVAAKQPAASTGYAVPNKNTPFGGSFFP